MAISVSAIIFVGLWVGLCTCSRRGSSVDESDEIKQKLDQVLQEMNRLVDDPAEKSALAQAKPFGHIKDLDIAAVGFTVPQKDKDRRIHVSFTLEYFNEHDVKTLAEEALKDWRSAAAESPLQK
jgi:hypothetical protein